MASTGTTRVDMITPDLQPKVLHAGDNYVGQPYLIITENSIIVCGDLNHGIVVTPDFGIGLVGPISLTTSPDQVSFCGGYWRINPMVLSCVGSSAAMPVPWLVPGTPDLIQASQDMQSAVSGMENYLD